MARQAPRSGKPPVSPARKALLAAARTLACALACACLGACGLAEQRPPQAAGKPMRREPHAPRAVARAGQRGRRRGGGFDASGRPVHELRVAVQPPARVCSVRRGGGTQAARGDVAVICVAGTERVLATLAGSGAEGSDLRGEPLLASNGDVYESASTGGAHALGAIVQVTPAGRVSDLYSFVGGPRDGAGPDQSLVQGPDGDLYGVTAAGGPGIGRGSVFELTLGGTERVLHLFSGSPGDGADPSSPLLLASDGDFYGTTSAGGAHQAGTLYRITAAGSYSTLYSFPAATRGGPLSIPRAALIQARGGKLVGTCLAGGRSNEGGVFSFDPRTGTESDLASLGGVAQQPLYGVIQARDGDFYGIENFDRSNVVFRVTPGGTASVVHDFHTGAYAALVQAVGRLVQGSDGDLYGVATSGGPGDGGGVFRVDPVTGKLSTVHDFDPAAGAPDSAPIQGLALGSNGWLYGVFDSPAPGGLFAID